jgi:hypothetical protein
MDLPQEAHLEAHRHVTRRHFLRDCTTGLGALWLATQGQSLAGAPSVARDFARPLAPMTPHFPGKA